MINLLHAEFYKLNKSIAIKICFLLACVCAVSLGLVSHGLAIGSLNANISGSASGLSEIVIISLLGSLLTGILVCSDFETKTIHDIVACGNGRKSVVVSKVVIYVLLIAMLLLPYMIATIVGFCTGEEFTKPFVSSISVLLLYDGANYQLTAATIGKIIVTFLVSALVYAARLSICIPLAFKIRKPIAIMAFGFVFSAIIDLVLRLLADMPLIGDIINISPFSAKFISLSLATEAKVFFEATLSSVIFLIGITIITYLTFKKAEIK